MSTYEILGEGILGQSLLGYSPVLPNPYVTTDGMRIVPEVWLADATGFRRTNLADTDCVVVDGLVTMNVDQAVKMTCQVQVLNPEAIEPYVDYIAPVMRIEYGDGRDDLESRMGVYATKIPTGDYRPDSSIATFDCNDMTSLAFESILTDTYSLGAGFAPESWAIDLIVASGIPRYSVPASGETIAVTTSRPPGTRRGDLINDLFQSVGFYTMHADFTGRVTTAGETRDLKDVEPFATITNDDIVSDSLRVIPSDRQVYNVAVVTNSNAQAPLVGTYRNDDPSSPSSTVNIGERYAPPEVMAGEPTQATLNKRARQIITEGRTFYRTAELTILPTPAALIPHQTIQLDTTGRLEPFAGKWWIRQASMGLTPANAATRLVISQVTRFDGSIV